jgi:hypothetical protein
MESFLSAAKRRFCSLASRITGKNDCGKHAAFIIIILILYKIFPPRRALQKTRENMTDWEIAENNYKENDCISTWDKLVGGIQSVATGGSFTDTDRANLVDRPDATKPAFSTCIKRTANYTLVCPNETIYVEGCDGVTYKNSCMAERAGIYNYTSGNGVTIND